MNDRTSSSDAHLNETMAPRPEAVQFSRTQGLLSATALGGSLVLGAGLFVAGSEFVRLSGVKAPIVYCVAPLLFLPIILSCIQRSSSPSAHTFYAAARSSGSASRLFFSAWLMLGGYLVLAALLAHGAAVRADIALERMFGLKIGLDTVVIGIVALAFVRESLTRVEGWRGRTAVFWSCAILLLALAAWGYFADLRSMAAVPKIESAGHWMLAVSMLASGLWSIDIVLSYRGQFRRPGHTSLWSLIAVLGGCNLVSALIMLETLRHPALMMKNWMEALSWQESRLEVLILITGFLLCASALVRVMTRSTRLIAAMMADNALPSSGNGANHPHYYSALFCALLVACASYFSVKYMLLLSGFAVLLSLVLYVQPLLRKEVSRYALVKLPMHPLFPVSSIALSIFLMWILPLEDLLIAGLWLLVGAALYAGGARKKMLPAMQQEQIFSTEEIQPTTAEYRVMVCLTEEEINDSLVRIGATLAAARNGELLVLLVLPTSEMVPSNVQRRNGRMEWERIRQYLENLHLPGQSVEPVVRLSPEPIGGIQATAREFAPDFLLVEWPDEPVERLRKTQLQSLLQLTARPVGILKGTIGEKPSRISVACGGSAHSVLALQLGDAIASASESKLEAVRIYSRLESEETAAEAVRSAIRQSGIRMPAELRLRQDPEKDAGIVNQTEGSDLLVLGASDDPLSGRLLADGPSMEVAMQRRQASLIVKSNEESSTYIMRRALSQASVHFSPLTPRERSELLVQLKVGLQARADFYLMVALAASIAITGLIMNDGSIVLGAMLVSPLMSPIVGIACGIALGNIDLMRRSGASTFKGMALVFGVGVLLTFLLPSVEPTDQILSRTRPGIFDLLAALAAGAAGAYSLSKKSVAGAIPGVAMSLSLEPPLATAGYGISTSQFWIAGGAFLLFLTNLAAIVLSGVAVYLLLGMRPSRRDHLYVVSKAAASVVLVILLLSIPLGLGTRGVVRKGHMKYEMESIFRTEAVKERFQLLDLKISETDTGFLIHPTVLTDEEVTPEQVEKLRKALEEKMATPIQLQATIIQTKRIESAGTGKNKE